MPEISHNNFNGDNIPCDISLYELKYVDLSQLPEGTCLWVNESAGTILEFFGPRFSPPICTFRWQGNQIIVRLSEVIDHKTWSHKYHTRTFAESMVRAVMRLEQEGHPLTDPIMHSIDDADLCVHWSLLLSKYIDFDKLIDSLDAAAEVVWQRANSILDNSDSVLVLGKDVGTSLEKLERISDELEKRGYYTYIIKEEPDRLGESIIQKVLRYALSSKFVLIENSEPSGHLYEIPHITKLAECITVVLQEEGRGATWMFEDAYAKHRHWHKVNYSINELSKAISQAVAWAESFHKEFSTYQREHLPWFS